MSYLLKRLKELGVADAENVKKVLYREGFASNKMDTYYEVKDFYLKRVDYYQRRKINNPKTQAYHETCKAFQVSENYIRYCVQMNFD